MKTEVEAQKRRRGDSESQDDIICALTVKES